MAADIRASSAGREMTEDESVALADAELSAKNAKDMVAKIDASLGRPVDPQSSPNDGQQSAMDELRAAADESAPQPEPQPATQPAPQPSPGLSGVVGRAQASAAPDITSTIDDHIAAGQVPDFAALAHAAKRDRSEVVDLFNRRRTLADMAEAGDLTGMREMAGRMTADPVEQDSLIEQAVAIRDKRRNLAAQAQQQPQQAVPQPVSDPQDPEQAKYAKTYQKALEEAVAALESGKSDVDAFLPLNRQYKGKLNDSDLSGLIDSAKQSIGEKQAATKARNDAISTAAQHVAAGDEISAVTALADAGITDDAEIQAALKEAKGLNRQAGKQEKQPVAQPQKPAGTPMEQAVDAAIKDGQAGKQVKLAVLAKKFGVGMADLAVSIAKAQKAALNTKPPEKPREILALPAQKEEPITADQPLVSRRGQVMPKAQADALSDISAREKRDMRRAMAEEAGNPTGVPSGLRPRVESPARAPQKAALPDVILRTDGKPFASATEAERVLKRKDAADTHEVAPAPEGNGVVIQAKRKGPSTVIDAEKDDILSAIAKVGGVDWEQARAQGGFDPAESGRRGSGIMRVFKKNGGMPLDRMAETLSQYGYPVTESDGNYSVNALLDAMDAALRGGQVGTPQFNERLAREAYEREAEMRSIDDALDNTSSDMPSWLDDGADNMISVADESDAVVAAIADVLSEVENEQGTGPVAGAGQETDTGAAPRGGEGSRSPSTEAGSRGKREGQADTGQGQEDAGRDGNGEENWIGADRYFNETLDSEYGPGNSKSEAAAFARTAAPGTTILETIIRPSGKKTHLLHLVGADGYRHSSFVREGDTLSSILPAMREKLNRSEESLAQMKEKSSREADANKEIAKRNGYVAGLRLGDITPNTGKLLRSAVIIADHGNGVFDVQGTAGNKQAVISGMTAASIERAVARANGEDSFSLTAQTEAERLAEERRRAAAIEAERKAEEKARQKAEADRDIGYFTLTGSDRPEDVAVAAGQNDLFWTKTREEKEAERKDEERKQAEADKAHAEAVDAAKYLKDIVYSLENLVGDNKRLLANLSSKLGKSGRDSILMNALGITREQAHDINNRLDDRMPHKLRAVDMQDAYERFPALKRIIDDAEVEVRVSEEARKARSEQKDATKSEYKDRLSDRLSRIASAKTAAEVDAINSEEERDSERHMEGTGKVRVAGKDRKFVLEREAAAAKEKQAYDNGEWVSAGPGRDFNNLTIEQARGDVERLKSKADGNEYRVAPNNEAGGDFSRYMIQKRRSGQPASPSGQQAKFDELSRLTGRSASSIRDAYKAKSEMDGKEEADLALDQQILQEQLKAAREATPINKKFDSLIATAADSPAKLREHDIERVLDNAGSRTEIIRLRDYLVSLRPDKADFIIDAANDIGGDKGFAMPDAKPAPIASAQPRTLDETGRATDGKPILPGDTFNTLSGRTTTPYPKQKGEKYASQWLIDNAKAEAESRGDDFNAGIFGNTKPLKRGELTIADHKSMLMYLFGEQSAVVPSILKPLVPESGSSPAATSVSPRDALINEINAAIKEAESTGLTESAKRLRELSSDVYDRIETPENGRKRLAAAINDMKNPLLSGDWVSLGRGRIVFRWEGMEYGRIEDTRITEDRGDNVSNPWRTSDGELHGALRQAKKHESDTSTKPRLERDGYIQPEGSSNRKTAELSRTRAAEPVMFDRPFEGNGGTKLIGYDWKNREEHYVDARGEDRVRRVSDWGQADTNSETGRDIVHHFIVEDADGKQHVVSAETAADMLGVSADSVRRNASRMADEQQSRIEAEANAKQSSEEFVRMLNEATAHDTPAKAAEDALGGDLPGLRKRGIQDARDWQESPSEFRDYNSRRELPFFTKNGKYVFADSPATDSAEIGDGWKAVSLKAGDIWPARRSNSSGQQEPAKQEVITDFGEKIGGARKDTAGKSGSKSRSSKADDRPAWARRFEVSQIVEISGVPDAGKWVIRDNRNLDWKKQPRQVGRLHDTREAAEAEIPLIAVAMKHRAIPLRDGKYEIWREVSDRKRVKVVDQVFDSRDEAMRYMAQHATEIIETNTTFGEADLPRPDSTARVGKDRRKGNVRDSDFMSVFGFRGVEFGNWNNQGERQDLLNDAYDALLDLAEVMGIPPKGISLDGELALAFGARGQGLSGARAHYERNKAVINLTKMNGAGSLAHEWFHALDHYFGRQDGKSSSEWVTDKDGTRSLKASTTPESDYASGGMRGERSGMRAELQKAYRDVITTMAKKAEKYVEDTAKADDFAGRARDDVREKLDSIRKHLADQLDTRYYKRNNKPASAEQLAEFDAIAERIVAGEALETKLETTKADRNAKASRARISLSGMRWTNDALERISAIMKDVRGRQGFTADQSGPLDELRRRMTIYSSRLKMLADAQGSTEKTRAVPTEFAMNAKELDQGRGEDYWTRPHEMAARAFQGYVEDKIAAMSGKSPFLNYAPESAVIPTPWGWKRPFPHGSERTAINAAFDRFVDTIETAETENGVKLYSASPSPFSPGLTIARAREVLVADPVLSKALPYIDIKNSTDEVPSGAEMMFLPAWHGSPYRFDKFSLEHMGKGEGNQAYGWGLYFAGNKAVAEFYRKALAFPDFDSIDVGVIFEAIKKRYYNSSYSASDLIDDIEYRDGQEGSGQPQESFDRMVLDDMLRDWWNDPDTYGRTLKIAEDVGAKQSGGQLYRVEIPEDDTYLLWDKPMSEQPQAFINAVMPIGLVKPGSDPYGGDIYEDMQSLVSKGIIPKTGKSSAESVSRWLFGKGVNGVRYLDGDSRASVGKKDSYNYVVFDENAVQIAETYYSAGSNNTAEGYYHNGRITLFADNIRAFPPAQLTAEERLKWVAFHEITHRGIANLSDSETYLSELGRAAKHPFVKNLAKKIYEHRQTLDPKYHVSMEEATEEALAEINSALRTGNIRQIKEQYGLHFPLSIRPRVRSAVSRFFESVKRIIKKAFGRGLTDEQLEGLLGRVTEAGVGHGPGKKKGGVRYSSSDNKGVVRDLFRKVQEAQRFGKGVNGVAPEDAFHPRKNENVDLSGAFQVMAEHVGDLVHRAAMPMDETEAGAGIGPGGANYGISALREKVSRFLPRVRRGEADDFRQQARRNAEYYLDPENEKRPNYKTVDEAEALFVAAAKRYADAYKQVPVFTKLQLLSREAAVALGEFRFDDLLRHLEAIDRIISDDSHDLAVAEYFKIADSTGMNAGIRYSTGPSDWINNQGRITKRQFSKETAALDLSVWQKTLGTQLNTALKNPAFKKVYDLTQRLIQHVNNDAYDSLNAAPDVLSRLEDWKDYKRDIGNTAKEIGAAATLRQSKRQKDMKAAAEVLFEGTRFDKKAYSDKELDGFGLTADQKEIYRQARAAIDKSVGNAGKSQAIAAAMNAKAVNWQTMERLVNADLEPDALFAELRDLIDARVADAKNEIGAGVTPERKEALKKKIATWEQASTAVTEIEAIVEQSAAEGYAPLMRWGRYTVAVMDPANGKTLRFHMLESKREQAALALKLEDKYGKANVVSGTMNESRFEQFKGITPETMALFASVTGMDQDAAYQEYLKLAIPGRSALKRKIHRKGDSGEGIEGFSTDLPRVLSSFVLSNARKSARDLYRGRVDEAIEEIPNNAGGVKDQAVKLGKFVMEPDENDWSVGIRNMLFVWNMGASVAFGVLNMSQPWMMTLPWLSQFRNPTEVAGIMGRAAKLAVKAQISGRAPNGYEAEYDRAVREGIVDPQNVFMLQGVERGKSGVTSSVWRNVSHGMGLIAAATESMNRKLTLIAALDVARNKGDAWLKSKGFADAYDFAARAVAETQGIYNKGNRPAWARNPFGAVLLVFKQYAINWVEMAQRMAMNHYGDDKYRKGLWMLIGMLFMMAGGMGLPFAKDISDLIETGMSASGRPVNIERQMQMALGKDLYEPLMYGPANSFLLNPMGADMHGRMSMGNMIPATAALNSGMSKTARGDEAMEVFGAGAGLVSKFVDAYDQASAGNLGDAMIAASPRSVASIAKSVEMATSGKYTDSKGRTVRTVTPAEALIKGMDLQPASVARIQRERSLRFEDEAIQSQAKTEIRNDLIAAYESGDRKEIDAAEARLDEWNRNNPLYPVEINRRGLRKTIRERGKSWSARDEAPKGMEWMDEWIPEK